MASLARSTRPARGGLVTVATPAPHAPSLLPSASSDLMLAQSLVSAARRPLPADLIRSMWNPWTCPADLLPYMAAGLGLEIWRDSWPEGRQREIIADIWRLKRNKTKLKGIREYLGLVDATLVSAHRPRDACWLVRTMTEAERAAQMAAMPQIRIHPPKAVAATLPRAFVSGRFVRQALCGRALCASDAAALYAGRADYVDGGVETPVTLRGIDGTLDASITITLAAPGSIAKLFVARGRAFLGRGALMASDAGDHVLAITPSKAAPSFAVPRGLVPSTVRPVHVAEVAAGRPGQIFLGRAGVGRGALLASDALDHVYDQVTLFDPSRTVTTRTPYSFVGSTRMRRRAYTAEILVDVPLTRPALGANFGQPVGGRFVRRSDMSPFWDAVRAVRTAKAFRDNVWIDTQLYRPIRFSAGLRFGDPGFARFGDSRKTT